MPINDIAIKATFGPKNPNDSYAIRCDVFIDDKWKEFFPCIFSHWKKYQTALVNKLKDAKESLVMAGDGRHDSMGFSAKYCAYTIFCCTIPVIIQFSLVQVSSFEPKI